MYATCAGVTAATGKLVNSVDMFLEEIMFFTEERTDKKYNVFADVFIN